jgi:primosomal protein N'
VALESFFEATSRVRKNGKILLVLDSFHPIVSALTRWNPSLLIKKILRENAEAFLPPYSAIASLKVPLPEGVLLKNGIVKSIKDARLPEMTRVYLSENHSKDEARLLISVPRQDRKLLVDFVSELTRRRAISHKTPISIAIDPYALMS